MGLFGELLRSAFSGGKAISEFSRSGGLEDKNNDGAPDKSGTTPKLQSGGQLEIVGESYYSKSFERLAKFRGSSSGEEKLRVAELHVEPGNKFSKSGKAVSVKIQGHQVGHLPERIAPMFFDFLSTHGGSAECTAQISFDSKEYGYKWSSVWVGTQVPPVLETEAADLKVASLAFGSIEHDLGACKAISVEGTILGTLNVGDSFLGEFNLVKAGDRIVIHSVDEVPLLELDDPKRQTLLSGFDALFYLSLSISRTDDGYRATLISNSELTRRRVRTGYTISAAGNTLSRRHTIFLVPTDSGWIKFKSFNEHLPSIPGVQNSFVSGSAVYLWATLDYDGRLFSAPHGGLLGTLYAVKEKWFRTEFKKIRFQALTRISVNGGKFTVEANVDASSEFLPMPERPVIPVVENQLPSKSTIIQSGPKQQKKKTEIAVKPAFATEFDIARLEEGEITGSGFTYFEDFIWNVFVELGWRGGNRVTKSRSSVFVAGSNLELDSSSAARDAAKYSVPIVPIKRFRELAQAKLRESANYRAIERYERWLVDLGANLASFDSPLANLLGTGADTFLVPGGAVDARSPSEDLSFIGSLTGTSESKEALKTLFESLGGQVLDCIILKAQGTYSGASPNLRLEFSRGGVFLGRTPANQYESLAESAQLYGIKEAWVRLDWKSSNRFSAEFDFYATLKH